MGANSFVVKDMEKQKTYNVRTSCYGYYMGREIRGPWIRGGRLSDGVSEDKQCVGGGHHLGEDRR